MNKWFKDAWLNYIIKVNIDKQALISKMCIYPKESLSYQVFDLKYHILNLKLVMLESLGIMKWLKWESK